MPVVVKLDKHKSKMASLSEMRRYANWQSILLKGTRFFGWTLVFLAVFVIFFGGMGRDFILPPKSALILSLLAVSTLIGLFSLGWISYKSRQWTANIRMLCESESPRAVGSLLEVLSGIQMNEGADPGIQNLQGEVWASLIRLLPCLEPQDSSVLSDEQRAIMWTILRNDLLYEDPLYRYDRENSQMHHAIVAALKTLGDSRDLPVLRDLASGRIPDIAQSVKQEAGEAVEAIMGRMGGERSRQELLRPSQAVVSTQELLRPAGYSQTAPAEEMLRASSHEE